MLKRIEAEPNSTDLDKENSIDRPTTLSAKTPINPNIRRGLGTKTPIPTNPKTPYREPLQYSPKTANKHPILRDITNSSALHSRLVESFPNSTSNPNDLIQSRKRQLGQSTLRTLISTHSRPEASCSKPPNPLDQLDQLSDSEIPEIEAMSYEDHKAAVAKEEQHADFNNHPDDLLHIVKLHERMERWKHMDTPSLNLQSLVKLAKQSIKEEIGRDILSIEQSTYDACKSNHVESISHPSSGPFFTDIPHQVFCSPEP